MPSRVRNTFAVVLGAAVAVTVVFVGDAVVHHFWPLPPGIDAHNRAQVDRALAAFPLIAFLVLVCGWMLATALGAFVAIRLSSPRYARSGRLVTILILLGTIANLAGIHHPGWMWPAAILLVLLGGWIGTRVGLGATPAQAAAT